MGCAPSQVDLAAEVNLYHFELHRVAGKGSFGKVCLSSSNFLLLFLNESHAGSRRGTQKNQKTLCTQVHRQEPVHQAEVGRQYHPGKAIA